MTGFGVKIRLVTTKKDVENLQSDIQNNIIEIDIGNALTVGRQTKINQKIQEKIDAKKFMIKQIEVGKIDAKNAINRVKVELEHMVSALRVDTGVNITGIKDFIDADGIREQEEGLARFAAQLESVTAASKGLSKVYSSVFSSDAPSLDTDVYDKLIQKYTDLQERIQQFSTGKTALNDDDIASLQQEIVSMRELIDTTKELQAERKQAADDAKKQHAHDQAAAMKAADQAAKAAEREAQTREATKNKIVSQRLAFDKLLASHKQGLGQIEIEIDGEVVNALDYINDCVNKLADGADLTNDKLEAMVVNFKRIQDAMVVKEFMTSPEIADPKKVSDTIAKLANLRSEYSKDLLSGIGVDDVNQNAYDYINNKIVDLQNNANQTAGTMQKIDQVIASINAKIKTSVDFSSSHLANEISVLNTRKDLLKYLRDNEQLLKKMSYGVSDTGANVSYYDYLAQQLTLLEDEANVAENTYKNVKIEITKAKIETEQRLSVLKQIEEAEKRIFALRKKHTAAELEETFVNKETKEILSEKDIEIIPENQRENIVALNAYMESSLKQLSQFKEEGAAAGDEFEKISSTVRNINTLFGVANQHHDDQIADLKQVAALQARIIRYKQQNTKLTREEQLVLDGFLRATQQRDITNGTLSTITQQFTEFDRQITEAGRKGKSVLNTLANAFEKFGGWQLVTRALGKVGSLFRDMIKTVINLDTAMTELKKVTNATSLEYTKFFNKAIERSKELGATVTDVINSSADFARLGYGLEDAANLADAAIVYKNVGDGIDNISTASESIISTMKAFGIAAEDAMRIVDAFNEVGNNFAISSVGIGEALVRSASGLAEAGATMEESIALVAAMNEVVQDPEKVGTTMKTLSMFLRASKVDAEEAGEATDGMANSVSELRDSILKLTNNRVDIMLNETEYKGVYQIMKEIAGVYSDMADIDQAALLELIGGKRNSNAVAALLNNFSTAERALESASQSAGSAMEENEHYLDSINGKISEIKASFEALSASLINSGFVKDVIESGTGILNVLTLISDHAGSLSAVATALTPVITLLRTFKRETAGAFSVATEFNEKLDPIGANVAFFGNTKQDRINNRANRKLLRELMNGFNAWNSGAIDTEAFSIPDVFEKQRKSLEKYFTTLEDGKATLHNYNQFLRKTGESTKYAGIQAAWAATKAAAYNMVLNTVISFAITGAIQAIAKLYDSLANAAINASERAQEAYEKSSEQANAYREQVVSLDELIDRYKQLASQEFVGAESRLEIRQIEEDIINLVGDHNAELDLVNGNLYEQLAILREIHNIEAGTYSGSLVSAYQDAYSYAEAATGSSQTPFFIWGKRGSYEYVNQTKWGGMKDAEAFKLLTSSDYDYVRRGIIELATGNINLGNVEGVEDVFDRIEIIKELINTMHNAEDFNYSDSDMYNSLIKQLDEYETVAEYVRTTANNLLQHTVNETFASVSKPVDQSVDSINAFGDSVIDAVMNSKDLEAAFDDGVISVKDVTDAVLDLMHTEFPEWSSEVLESQLRTNKINSVLNRLFSTGNPLYSEDRPLVLGDSPSEVIEAINNLSDEDLTIAYSIMVEKEGVATLEQLLEEIAFSKTQEGQIIRANERINASLRTLWNSDDFAESKDELVKLSKTVDGIDSKTIENLAAESEELSSILNETGMSSSFLAKILQEVAKGNDGFELITEDALRLNEALFNMEDEFNNLTAARNRFNDAMSVEEKDEAFKSYAEAYKTLGEEIENGTINSNTFWAAAEYLFGSDQLNEWGWGDGIDQIVQSFKDAAPIFKDAETGAIGFVEQLYKAHEAGLLVNKDGENLIDMEKTSSGYTFAFDPEDIAEIAKVFNLSEEAITACFQALSMFGNINWMSNAEVLSAIDEYGMTATYMGNIAVNADALRVALKNLGKTDKEIYDIFKMLESMENVELIDITSDANTLAQSLVNLGVASNTDGTLYVEYSSLAEMLRTMEYTREEAMKLLEALASIDGVKFKSANGEIANMARVIDEFNGVEFAESTQDGLGALNDATKDVNDMTLDNIVSEFEEVGLEVQSATSDVKDLRREIKNLDGTEVDVKVRLRASTEDARLTTNGTTGNGFGGDNSQVAFGAYASGTDGAPGGESLLGEEGAELVQSGSEAYLAGTHGAEIVDLKKGDRVFTADETKKILHGRRSKHNVIGRIKAFAGGTGVDRVDISGAVGKPKLTLPKNENPTENNNPGDLTLPSTHSTSSGSNLESLKKKLDELITDYTHKIFLLEKENATASEIISIYKTMQDEVKKLEDQARAQGLNENDEYIQQLQKQWWEYQDSITQLRENEFRDYLNDHKFSIDSMMQNNGSMDEIVDAWHEVLNAIRDELQYYEDLGYDAGSDIIQSLTNELWSAKSEIQNALDEIISKANSAVDDLQSMYSTLQDAAQEFAETGYISVDTLQSIISLGVEYMSFLQDENGQLVINEQNVRKMIAAKTEQLAVESALSYVEQLKLALSENNEAELQRLLTATTNATNATWGLVYANLALLDLDSSQYTQALANINNLRSLAANAVAGVNAGTETVNKNDDARKDYYDEASDGLETILDLTMDLIKHEKEQQIEALEDQIDKYQEIIDLKKESLDATKDENDYNDEVAERIEEIARLQSQIDMLSLDDSREARSQRLALEEELASKQKELADYQSDYSIDKQKEALDAQGEAFEQSKNNEIAAIEQTISSTEKLYQLAIARINADWQGLYTDLINYNYEYGTMLQSDLVSAWNAASAAVQEYGGYVQAVNAIKAAQENIDSGTSNVVGSTVGSGSVDSSTGNMYGASNITSQMRANAVKWWTGTDAERSAIEGEQSRLAEELSALIGEDIRGSGATWYRADGSSLFELSQNEVAKAIVTQMKKNSSQWPSSSDEGKRELEEMNKTLAKRLQGYLGKQVSIDGNGVWWIDGKKLYDVYHKGGIVGGNPTLKQNEVMAILEKGESVLDQEKQDGLYEIVDFAQELSKKLGVAIKSFNPFGISSAFDNRFMPSPVSAGMNSHNEIHFAPQIEVNIQPRGALDETEARRIGDTIADNTMQRFYSAFAKKGLKELGNSLLKP